MIRHSESIAGLNINGKTYKLMQYADDTILTLNGSEDDLRNALNILDEFASFSHLKLNVQKTHAIWIGKNKAKILKLLPQYNLNWVFNGYFRYL